MRDKTADRRFNALKKVESFLENTFPDRFRSRYAMVCYGGEGNVTYKNAYALGPIQEEILTEILNSIGPVETEHDLIDIAKKVDLDLASRLLEEKLVPHLS